MKLLSSLRADPSRNPYASRGLLNDKISGWISKKTSDSEGNQFSPEKMDFTEMLSTGYLDIDHLYFYNKDAKDAIIGIPEQVDIYDDGVVGTFRLINNQQAKDVKSYLKDNPKVLGFSIAGMLKKEPFSRDGSWQIVSTGISRFPIHAGTGAVALSSITASRLLAVMSALATKLNSGEDFDSYSFFAEQVGDPILATALSVWVNKLTYKETLQVAPQAFNWDRVYKNLFVNTDETNAMREEILNHWQQWLELHPDDIHFTKSSKSIRSWNDAIEHLRTCEGLNRQQVATIMGYLRGNPSSIEDAPHPVTGTDMTNLMNNLGG